MVSGWRNREVDGFAAADYERDYDGDGFGGDAAVVVADSDCGVVGDCWREVAGERDCCERGTESDWMRMTRRMTGE